MDDQMIIELYFERDERALSACEERFGGYCEAIARNILGNDEDAKEIFNDVLLRSWNSIPPERPESLRAYLGTLARNLSLALPLSD